MMSFLRSFIMVVAWWGCVTVFLRQSFLGCVSFSSLSLSLSLLQYIHKIAGFLTYSLQSAS